MKSNRVRIFLIVVEVFLFGLAMLASVSAFENGSASQDYNVYDPSYNLDDWLSKGHYGTHDWLANAALDAILQDPVACEKWKDGDGNSFWTKRRKLIFFIGTEAPDTPSTPYPQSQDEWLKITLNGIEVGGWGSVGEKKTHRLIFYPNDEQLSIRMTLDSFVAHTFSTRVKKYEQKARNYLEEGKCELAAFYMGAVVHYISDMASFFHVLDFGQDIYDINDPNKDKTQQRNHWNSRHGLYEKGVQYSTNDPYHRDKVFSYSTSFTIRSDRDSVTCAKLLAFSTRWDLYVDEIHAGTPGSDNADVLWDYFNVYGSSIVDNWESWFKARTQELLQDAIRASADAINYIADAWALGDDPKSCEECNKQDQEAAKNEAYLRKLAGASLGIFLFIGLAGFPIVDLLIPIMFVATTPRETPFPTAV